MIFLHSFLYISYNERVITALRVMYEEICGQCLAMLHELYLDKQLILFGFFYDYCLTWAPLSYVYSPFATCVIWGIHFLRRILNKSGCKPINNLDRREKFLTFLSHSGIYISLYT